jgi:hypothetical protein
MLKDAVKESDKEAAKTQKAAVKKAKPSKTKKKK